MRFTISKPSSSSDSTGWALVVHHPNGSSAGIGELNGEEEAKLVCKSLNVAVANDELEKSRWRDYFEKPSPTPPEREHE